MEYIRKYYNFNLLPTVFDVSINTILDLLDFE